MSARASWLPAVAPQPRHLLSCFCREQSGASFEAKLVGRVRSQSSVWGGLSVGGVGVHSAAAHRLTGGGWRQEPRGPTAPGPRRFTAHGEGPRP